jgi:hypothetical protein
VSDRFVSSANRTASERPSVRLFVAADLDFPSGHVRAHDGIGTMTFGGYDYEGVGRFGGIDLLEETIDLIATGVKLSLSGLDSDLVQTAMDEDVYQGRAVVLHFGLVDNDTNQLIDTPEILWEGHMDQMSISLDHGMGSINLTCEHRLRSEPRIARYTDADQHLAYPGDRFFDLVPKIAGYRGKWGAFDVVGDGSGRSGHYEFRGRRGRVWVWD